VSLATMLMYVLLTLRFQLHTKCDFSISI